MLLFPSFAVYVISMVGETNRAPFDLPEAEGELVGGFHTEYSSLKFALFFLAEYINMVTVSALATTLFLGGWRAPWPLSLWDGANQDWWPILWFVTKVLMFLFVFIWLRGTLPRLRYDQFMRLGWKVLIPVAIGWLLMVATVRALNAEYSFDTRQVLIYRRGDRAGPDRPHLRAGTSRPRGARASMRRQSRRLGTRWRVGIRCRRCPGRTCRR